MTAADRIVISSAPKAPSGRVSQLEAYCPDCGAGYQEVGDGFRCPWAKATRQRIEHDEPGFRVVACGRP